MVLHDNVSGLGSGHRYSYGNGFGCGYSSGNGFGCGYIHKYGDDLSSTNGLECGFWYEDRHSIGSGQFSYIWGTL